MAQKTFEYSNNETDRHITKPKIIHIMIIGSKYKNEQETKNALVERLISGGFTVHINSYDIISEEKANLGYSREAVLARMKYTPATMPSGINMKSEQVASSLNEAIFYFDNCTLRRIAVDIKYANEDFYKDEFNKNKDASYHFIIDGIGYDPEAFRYATRSIRFIEEINNNVAHIDWCTCCADPKVIPTELSRRNSNDASFGKPINILDKECSSKYQYKSDAYDIKYASKDVLQKLNSANFSDDVVSYLTEKQKHYCNTIAQNTVDILINGMDKYLQSIKKTI